MTKDEHTISKFFKCECYGHALQVEHELQDKLCNITMWQYGSVNRPLPFRERLRWTWKLLSTGTLWADEICLSEQTRDDLIKFLQNNKKENNEKD